MYRSDERAMSRSAQYASGVLLAGVLFLGLTAAVHSLMRPLSEGMDRYIALHQTVPTQQISTAAAETAGQPQRNG
ncbi:hypothetical protein [Chitinimonas lacunae]|uniref:Uncharacterized protein n=1 Tax=Chitinimonas lacunae TaxID=1963018 RepID=A0ABV8MKK6_9NEIS